MAVNVISSEKVIIDSGMSRNLKDIADTHTIQGDAEEICIYLYMEWIYQFINTSPVANCLIRFANHYGISIGFAQTIIDDGRILNIRK